MGKLLILMLQWKCLQHLPDKSCSFDCPFNPLCHPSPFSIKPPVPLTKQCRAAGEVGLMGPWGRGLGGGETKSAQTDEAFTVKH